MMEPRIQYAQTADGVSIAFWTLGKGMPLVYMPPLQGGLSRMEWEIPEYRRWYEGLVQSRRLIHYDSRGSGLSQRDVTDFSLDVQVLDLEAVVERLGLERLGLFGNLDAGMVAVAYAARYPEKVSHLFLWCSCARASDVYGAAQLQAALGLIDQDWQLFTETMAHVYLGWSAGQPARSIAALVRECVTPQVLRASISTVSEFDVTSFLQDVRAPTLVLHRRQIPFPEVTVAKSLASRIPDAHLALLEGESAAPYMGDTEAVLSAIDEFWGEADEPAAEPPTAGAVHTVLFTDMESSTTLTQHLGDAKAQDVLRTHNTIVRDALKAHGGSEIKHTGDGIMASFPSASGALECAVVIQRAVAAHVEERTETPLRVRIGLNAGEPVAEEEDLFGTTVQLARRICDRAESAQILASDVVRQLAAGKGFLFSDQGETELRGFEDPVRLYEVRWQE